MTPSTKKLIGALVAAALAIAVFYGVIGQQQAGSIQSKADQTLGTAPATQQVVPPAAPNATAPATPPAPAPQTAPPPPQH